MIVTPLLVTSIPDPPKRVKSADPLVSLALLPEPLSVWMVTAVMSPLPLPPASAVPSVIWMSSPASVVKYNWFGVAVLTHTWPYAATSASADACSLKVIAPSTVNNVDGLFIPIPTFPSASIRIRSLGLPDVFEVLNRILAGIAPPPESEGVPSTSN